MKHVNFLYKRLVFSDKMLYFLYHWSKVKISYIFVNKIKGIRRWKPAHFDIWGQIR
jgi:hypothetical protein